MSNFRSVSASQGGSIATSWQLTPPPLGPRLTERPFDAINESDEDAGGSDLTIGKRPDRPFRCTAWFGLVWNREKSSICDEYTAGQHCPQYRAKNGKLDEREHFI